MFIICCFYYKQSPQFYHTTLVHVEVLLVQTIKCLKYSEAKRERERENNELLTFYVTFINFLFENMF